MKPHPNLAIHLSGGGARAAYQVGLLRCLGRHYPDLRFPIITGISAGAINAVCLAAHPGPVGEAAERLRRLWCGLEVDKVFRVDSLSLGGKLLRWGWRLVSGGGALAPEVRGLTDTRPLRRYLECALELEPTGEIRGIARNLEEGRLRALALVTSSFTTGQSIAWVQGCDVEGWERPRRRSSSDAPDPRLRHRNYGTAHSGRRRGAAEAHVVEGVVGGAFAPEAGTGGRWKPDGSARASREVGRRGRGA